MKRATGVSEEAVGKKTLERFGSYGFSNEAAGLKLTVDTLLLAEFCLPLVENARVADLGSGTGAIPLYLASKNPSVRVTGFEIDGNAASVSRKNIESNSLCERIEVMEGDYRQTTRQIPEGSYSLVVSNPPYVKAGCGRLSPDPARRAARSEESATLKDLIETSARLAGKAGRFCYIFPVKRLDEMFHELNNAGYGPRRLKYVHTRACREALLFLVEASARHGELKIEKPVVLNE